jgi:hypothetical protein
VHRQMAAAMAKGRKFTVCILAANLSETAAYAMEVELIAKIGREILGAGPLWNCPDRINPDEVGVTAFARAIRANTVAIGHVRRFSVRRSKARSAALAGSGKAGGAG